MNHKVTQRHTNSLATMFQMLRKGWTVRVTDINGRQVLNKPLNRVCMEYAKTYFSVRDDAERINAEAIEIWGEPIERDTMELHYGNLYSHVVAQGIVVPYDEWLYEDKVIIGYTEYYWDAATGNAFVTSLANTEPDEVDTVDWTNRNVFNSNGNLLSK